MRRYILIVGIAWFDERPPPMSEVTLRTGGLPLMGPATPWPTCGSCGLPMVFRAQLPLAVSGLVGFDDDRCVLVFECHQGSHGTPCTEGAVLVAGGDVVPREPPSSHLPIGRPPVLAPRGGKLVPFDEGVPGTVATTLPPLETLARAPVHGRLLGVLGGPTPGSVDPSCLCDCGRPMRTVVRLLAMDPPPAPHVHLGPTLVHACLRCNVGRTHRMVVPHA